MTVRNIADKISGIPLFSGLSPEKLSALTDNSEFARFSPGQQIVRSDGAEKDGYITVILSGSVAVTKSAGGKEVLMRMLGGGSVSGVVSVYDGGDSLSELTARTSVSAVFIDAERVRRLIRADAEFAESFIRFLSSRIRFLNIRIKAYTCGSAEARLAFHILQCDEDGRGKVNCGVSFTRLSGMLDIGRASLYRALDSLTERGVIEREGRDILIKDRQMLAEIANGLS